MPSSRRRMTQTALFTGQGAAMGCVGAGVLDGPHGLSWHLRSSTGRRGRRPLQMVYRNAVVSGRADAPQGYLFRFAPLRGHRPLRRVYRSAAVSGRRGVVTPPYGRCTEPRRLVVQQLGGVLRQAEGHQQVEHLGAVGGEVVNAPAAIILCGLRPIAGDGGGDGIVTVEDLQIEAGILPVSLGGIQNVYRLLTARLVVALAASYRGVPRRTIWL